MKIPEIHINFKITDIIFDLITLPYFIIYVKNDIKNEIVFCFKEKELEKDFPFLSRSVTINENEIDFKYKTSSVSLGGYKVWYLYNLTAVQNIKTWLETPILKKELNNAIEIIKNATQGEKKYLKDIGIEVKGV